MDGTYTVKYAITVLVRAIMKWCKKKNIYIMGQLVQKSSNARSLLDFSTEDKISPGT